MSIAATSISMHQQQLQQAVGVSLMKEVMDRQTQQAAELVQTVQQAIPPTVPGSHMDILA